ncbi:MAG TPA: metallophosphoesterase [Bacteroidales bacterium]|nr:metallophosphoesterase [Bacteroidales bacterium]
MKRRVLPFLYIVVILGIILALRAWLPKYAGMLLFFLLFLLFDGALWLRTRKQLFPAGRKVTFLLAVLFWLPHLLLATAFTFSLFVPFLSWNIPFRTLLQSTALILFLAHLFPVTALVLLYILKGARKVIRLTGARFPMPGSKTTRRVQTGGWALGFMTFLLFLAGTLFWQFDFRVRPVTIPLTDLPASFNGLRIVQISDVHLGSWSSRKRLAEAIDRINALHPDAVFFTGDMFNYCTADGDDFLPILKSLQAPLGIFAIAGNHDYGDYIRWQSEDAKRKNMDQFRDFYRELGWKLLMNEHYYLRRGNDSLAVIGVENWGATHRFQRLADLGKATAGVDTNGVQLLLSHDPTYWDRVVRKNYPWIDVTFSGHTHGGQIGIDCGNFRWGPIAWMSPLWNGLYSDTLSNRHSVLYVNPGLGNIGYAGRIGILPEITLFTLTSSH